MPDYCVDSADPGVSPQTSMPRQAVLVGFGSPRSSLQWRPRSVAPPLNIGNVQSTTTPLAGAPVKASPRARRLGQKNPPPRRRAAPAQRQRKDDDPNRVPQWWQALRAAVECVADPLSPPGEAVPPGQEPPREKALPYSKLRGWARELYAQTVKMSLDELDNTNHPAAWDEEALSAAMDWIRACGVVRLLPQHIVVLPPNMWAELSKREQAEGSESVPPIQQPLLHPENAAAMPPLRAMPPSPVRVTDDDQWGQRLGSARKVTRRVTRRAAEQLAHDRVVARRAADAELAAASRYFSPRWGAI